MKFGITATFLSQMHAQNSEKDKSHFKNRDKFQTFNFCDSGGFRNLKLDKPVIIQK